MNGRHWEVFISSWIQSQTIILQFIVFFLHFSWSWRTTSEVLRSWPRVSVMSNQSTQIGGKSLLYLLWSHNPKGSSSILSASALLGDKDILQDDLRFDTTRKNDLHYAERWSQDRGSLSPTTQSPQRSRFYDPLNFPNFLKLFQTLPQVIQPVTSSRGKKNQWFPGKRKEPLLHQVVCSSYHRSS